MWPRVLLLLALLLGVAGCSAPRFQPMTYHYGTPWSVARVNDRGGFFLVDTGAAITVLDEEMGRRADLTPRGEQELIGTSGRVMSRAVQARELEFAGMVHEDRRLALQNLAGFQAPGGRQQDGLIGCDFLLDYNVIFDMEQSRIALSRERAPVAGAMRPHAIQLDGGTPMVQVFLPDDPQPYWAKLDTGSGYSAESIVYLDVTRPLAQRLLGDRLNQPPDQQAEVISITGRRTLDIYEYGPVRILGKTMNPVRLVIREKSPGAFGDPGFILISGSLLRQFSVVEIDFPARQIWTAP